MKKNAIIISAFSLILFSCGRINDSATDRREEKMRSQAMEIHNSIKSNDSKKNKALWDYVSFTPLHEKICQLFIANLEGDRTYIPVEKDFIPGGYLFFSYNLAETPVQIMKFTDSIQSYCVKNGKIPPFLAIDQEGGLVNRLRTVAGPLPSAKRVSSRLNVSEAYRLYSMQAHQMKALGFHMNLAPVLEVQTAENEKFLDGRSFGNFENVMNYGIACINAFENQGIGCVIKHFPGNSNTDPHTGLPEIILSAEELVEAVKPFEGVTRYFPSGTIMSHARTKNLDGKNPACFSKEWVTEKLRKSFGFNGIIFSDDIFMGALAGNGFPPEVAAVRAIEAGINCIMISEKRISSSAKVLEKKCMEDQNFMLLIEESFKKIIEYKIKSGILTFNKENDGNFSVCAVSDSAEISERLNRFDDARKENIDLYQTYF